VTLTDIRNLLVSVDPYIKHYFTDSNADAFSYWEETRRLPMVSDDRHEQAWRFYVHRYTKAENDVVASQLFDALDQDPRIAFQYTVDFDADSGYIHHIYDCEGY
jgi:hypothetical protein